MTSSAEFFHSELTIEPPQSRPNPSLLRLEVISASPIISAYEAGKVEREQQLDAALKAIDFSPLEKGDQAAFDASLKAAHAKLEVLKPWLQQFRIRIVGNSHIDMAWLWPWTETVEVVRNTFQSVLDLMREYPDFKFTMSSARTYEWMQEKYPDLFAQIEQRVKEGRWEIIGGMWVEPDLNMPDGESLVRQILVGKRYFQKNFGVDVKIGWNPDSFGYNYQLPQIYKKSGMDYFVTQKLLMGARVHNVSLQAVLVASPGWKQAADLLPSRLRRRYRCGASRERRLGLDAFDLRTEDSGEA